MIEVKCECGHVNPHGTILCEACGKIIEEGTQITAEPVLDMRYEGSARRSQTYNKSIIDKVWNFFSSVKVGVWLIVVTLIASALGTILPQEMYIPAIMPVADYYEDQYGWFGRLYYDLGFHNLYSSWWYLLLIASIGVSLVICSLDRVVPLYRALKKQRVVRHESFLQRQRIFGVTNTPVSESSYELVKQQLKKRRYEVREENGSILAEKGRFSRWGPYVNHVGLIIFLIGSMLRFVPGMYVDKILWLREGETKVIPETDGEYYIKNVDFKLEVYDKEKDNEAFGEAIDRAGMVAKNYQTDIVLYKKKGNAVAGEEPELEEVDESSIRVNEPLKFEKFALYQVDYKLDELNQMKFLLTKKSTGEQFGDITIDLNDPEELYELDNGYSVELMSYFPDFEFGDDGKPTTKSRVPNNPAFVFKMYSPEKPDGEVSFVAIQQTIEPLGDNEYKMTFNGIETKDVTALTVRKDLTLWVIGLGGFIFMFGVVQGAYWNHRRIWVQSKGNEVWVAAHTNKNWFGLKKEIQMVLEGSEIKEPIDQIKENQVDKGETD